MGTIVAPRIRPARDGDGDALIALIGGCWAEYPGVILDVDLEEPQLRAITTHFCDRGGLFWVAEQGAAIVGCAGIAPAADPAGAELHKLYVRNDVRRSGLGGALTTRVEHAAREQGAAFIELWSDTRFVTAHRFYERLGYTRLPDTRDLHDLSNSTEYHFRKELLP